MSMVQIENVQKTYFSYKLNLYVWDFHEYVSIFMQQADPALFSPPFKVLLGYSTIHRWKLSHL